MNAENFTSISHLVVDSKKNLKNKIKIKKVERNSTHTIK